MGIGAPRAGTTWLWQILRLHPDIWMPPRKELHYFDRSLQYPSPSLLADDQIHHRLFGRYEHHILFRKVFLRSLVKTILIPAYWKDLPWTIRYFTGTCNDEWYLSLFDTKKKAVKGEITPAYSMLKSKDVKHIKNLFPAVKVIYLIRNPVDRAWSDIRLQEKKGKLKLDKVEDILQSIEDESQILRSDYARTISTWSASFPKDQMLVCFFDEIVNKPQFLLQNILTFLGVNPDLQFPHKKLILHVNATKEINMPEEVKRHLAQKYLPEIEKLIPMVGGEYCRTWLKEINNILVTNPIYY